MNSTTGAARVVALCNQKGGVGKTTFTAALAEVLTDRGMSVLALDLDPQANLTAHLGVESPAFTMNDVLTVDPMTRLVTEGVIAEAYMQPSEDWTDRGEDGEPTRRLELVAAELNLATREQDQDLGRELRLRRALAGATDRWDVVLVDCPPSLGQLTLNALIAADQALLVTDPRARSIDGLAQMVQTMGTVRDALNPKLQLAGIAVNRYQPRLLDQQDWTASLRESYGDLLVEPFVPLREAIAKAATAGQPLRMNSRAALSDTAGAVALVADRIVKD